MSKKGGKSRDMFDDYDSAFDPAIGSGKGSHYARCYESHPAITFKNAPGVLYGGSCQHPIVKDADVYVGLDYGMAFQQKHYPWLQQKPGPVEFQFKITDQAAPSDEKNFVAMIAWLKERLLEGKRVHVGCFGGHGRTGLVLAALVKEIDGIEDAITHVRQVYCKKAVESKVQVKFLNKTFGIAQVKGSKEGQHQTFGSSSSGAPYGGFGGATAPPRKGPPSNGQLPTHSERWDDFIPGTSIQRTRGPREPAVIQKVNPGEPIKGPDAPITVYGLENSPNSIW